MIKIRRYLLPVIFLLALVFRFWNLGTVPEAVDEDEMALGYYAYSLINSGTDEYGNKFPVYFESSGDYKYGLYSYFSTIPVAFLGLNAFSTRFVAALAGSLSVIAIYFLVLEISGKRLLSLISAFVLALSPSHIHFSRVAYSNILGALFAIFSVLFLLRWLKKSGGKNVVFTFLFFTLSIFTYQAYRVFLPAVFVLFSLAFFKKLKGAKKAKAALWVVLALVVVGISFISPESRVRSQGLSFLVNKPELIENFSEDNLAGTSLLTTRIVHNKATAFTLGFARRYFSYFDPVFLFSQTSPGAERHSTPGVGLLYLVEALFLLLGVVYAIKIIKAEGTFLSFSLLLSSPIAASMVIEGRSTTRGIVVVFAYAIFIALGIYHLIKEKKLGKYLVYPIGLAYAASFFYFSHQYLVHKKYHHPWHSDFGLKEMVQVVNDNYENYKAVIMQDGHNTPYLFYNKVLPEEFIEKSDFAHLALANGVRVERFDKIYFNMPECPLAGKAGVLYVCFGYRVPRYTEIVDIVRFRDGQPAVILFEFTGKMSETPLPERTEYLQDAPEDYPNGVLPDGYGYFWPTR